MKSVRWCGVVALVVLATHAGAAEFTLLKAAPQSVTERLESFRVAQARTCKAVSSCEEAVKLWCGGYRRADGDNDGIPCENVCSSVSQVEAIKAKIGC
ncbi:excalibur calcium-binding domain-containing protein [Aureimonas sp. AU12]|uniref:excalibur calcium-binding domain-containing protein n=1 Tax=Aureimonas sp. AU12 TaxID=1638161 RepID=UPI0009E78DA7|nr:excalibur calcium-binding domain-containing protein [Aureimonas sp. AU12]